MKKTLFLFVLFIMGAYPSLYGAGDGDEDEHAQDREIRELDSLIEVAHAWRFSKSKKARALCERLEQKAEKLDHKKGMARVLAIRGETVLFQNDSSRAFTHFQRADSIYRELSDKAGMAQWRSEAGKILLNKLRYEKAETLFQEARRRYKEAGAFEEKSRTHLMSARSFRFQSYYTKALRHAHRAKELFDSLSNRLGIGKSKLEIGRIHWDQGNHNKALRSFQKAKELFKAENSDGGLARIHQHIGKCFQKRESEQKALKHFRKAYSHNIKADNPKGAAYARTHLAGLLMEKGLLDSCMSLYRKTLRIFRNYQDLTGVVVSMKGIGKIHMKRGAADSALFYFNRTVPHAERIKNFEAQVSLHKLIAKVHARQDRERKAYEELKKANEYEDSLHIRKQKEKMAELEAKYETKQRKKELELQDAQLRQKNFEQKVLFGGLGLVLLFSGFLYYQVRQKKKANHSLLTKNRIIEEKNRDILQSLRYASRIQNAVLPEEERIRSYFGSGFILFKPRDMVSGDLYWMEETSDHFFFAVVDCTGHGVPGALISILAHNGLNKAVLEKGLRDPADILGELDEQLRNTFQRGKEGEDLRDGMDIALCSFSSSQGELRYAGAIEPLYLIRSGNEEIEVYKGDRFPIGNGGKGIQGKKDFTSYKIGLNEGDRFYIFSDGYPDQFGGKQGKKLKYKAFRKILLEHDSKKDLNEQRKELDQTFEEWRGEHEQVDDVLVIGAKV
ncbi:MAG: SpoIIE family protein phosphatase [Flavobacteriales bacterium]